MKVVDITYRHICHNLRVAIVKPRASSIYTLPASHPTAQATLQFPAARHMLGQNVLIHPSAQQTLPDSTVITVFQYIVSQLQQMNSKYCSHS